MTSISILVGNSEYENFQNLPCCIEDLKTMERLVRAADKHSSIVVLQNQNATELKNVIRETIGDHTEIREFFFYFTGHGHNNGSDFYFCLSDFKESKPNETGLSHSELQELVRATTPNFAVFIIDACFSGTPLIKSENSYLPEIKKPFSDFVQIASSLSDQESQAGDPLSHFTENLSEALLSKESGPIYYLDIISNLKDKYLNSSSQTPHFVLQGASREYFVDDAKRFDAIRAQVDQPKDDEERADQSVTTTPIELSPAELLAASDAQYPDKPTASSYILEVLNALTDDFLNEPLCTEYYETKSDSCAFYDNRQMKPFIVRVLEREPRIDRFVFAKSERVEVKDFYNDFIYSSLFRRKEYTTEYYLKLNADFEKIQTKITFTPRFKSLNQFVLTVSCAPSLSKCYLFEHLSRHSLEDWESYGSEGAEINRRWYKLDWNENHSGIQNKIRKYLQNTLEHHIDRIVSSLHE